MALVVFDAYGTLWDIAQIVRVVNEVVGADDGAEFLSVWRQKQLEYAYLRTLMDRYLPFDRVTAQALGYTVRRFGLRLDAEDFDRLNRAWLEPVAFDDTLACLGALSPHQRVILSNGNPEMLAAGVEHTAMAPYFEQILSVDAARRFKPHPDAYRLVSDRFHVEPDAVVFVSSNGWDIAGAGSFGFRTVWIDRIGSPMDELEQMPRLALSSLAELADRLPTL